jgi:hypothetical protein
MPGMSSLPPPMQVLPVTPSYQSFPQYPQRPGVVTAMGVIGIVVSILSMLSAPGIAMFAATSLLTIQFQRQIGPAGDAMMYPLIPDTVVISAPDGVDAQRASFVVDALNSTRPLTPTRANHIRSLAMLHGKKLFPFGAEGMTVLRMKANVTESGPVLAGVGRTGDYYVTGTGRIEVTDQSAIFRPDDGPTVRSGDVIADRSLSEEQIDALLQRTEAMGRLSLTAAQASTIRRLLRDPQQSVITRRDESANSIAPDFYAAGPMQDNGVWFRTDKSQVRITADGTETLLNAIAPMPGTNPMTGQPAQSIWSQMVLVFQCISLGLAITMLVWAIGLLRGKPSARRLAVIWAILKLPVVVVGSVMLGLMVAEWFGMFRGAPGSNVSPQGAGWAVAITGGLIGLVWPIMVLVLANRRSVKDWVAMTR